ncbi:MAG TPA: Fe-S cluster assembly protein SufD [Anaeromyxobacteraceae bacterium]|nr:Fe-S cluster assembly protein SufD [Anaeromyxobacteraceae bacterium]
MTPTEASLLAEALPAPELPGFAAHLRRTGREAYGAAGLPRTDLEEWRFTSLAPLASQVFAPGEPHARVDLSALDRQLGPAAGPRLVFVNGRLRADLSREAALPGGASAGSLARALAERPALVEPHLGRLAKVEGRALAALNAALLADGAFVHLPAGSAVAQPIEIVFVAVAGLEPSASHPRVLVVGGPRSEATVVERYVALGTAPALSNAVTEVRLGEGARLDHYQVQDLPPSAFYFASVAAEQGPGSRFQTHSTALGAAIARSDVQARLAGEEAEARLCGLYMTDGKRLVDNHSLVEHATPRGTSREVFKGILDGESRAVFGGRVRVLEGAMKTDAHQLNSNLLLSRDATVDTMPQLEIYADDVKCGHGGTVGQLDADSLFYLRSRGLPLARARSLLIYAFAREMVDLVRPAALREQVGALVAARLPDGALVREAA